MRATLDLYAEAGLRVEPVHDFSHHGPLWDPRTPSVVHVYDRLDSVLGLHELAHYIVASREALTYDDYGLGTDRNIYRKETPTLRYKADEYEYGETRACLMNVALATEVFGREVREHALDELGCPDTDPIVEEARRWLQDQKLITDDGFWSRRLHSRA